MLWSFNLMWAASCVRFYLKRCCCEVNKLHVPHNKKDSDILSRTQFAARSSLDKKLKGQSGDLHSLFSLFYTMEWKTYGIYFTPWNGKLTEFRRFFSASIYIPGETLIRFPFQSFGSVYEVSLPWRKSACWINFLIQLLLFSSTAREYSSPSQEQYESEIDWLRIVP